MTVPAVTVSPILFRSGAVTPGAPHVRDAVNLGRIMSGTVLALLPALLLALYEMGRQANRTAIQLGAAADLGWGAILLDRLGVGHDPGSVLASALHGLLIFVPVYVVARSIGGFWEYLFARSRGTSTPGLAVTALLFSLALPPSTPLWQVAAGISFGVVVGVEIFGGSGKNFLNPALTGLAFLYFAYPDALRSPSTPISVPACATGAAVLLYTRIISWRVLAGGLAGVAGSAFLFQQLAPSLPLADMPWHWHLTAGGFAFGLVFFATDPVTSATTNPGRWIYGALVGFLTVLIRVANPSQTQEVMLAILFGNIAAPLIDYGVTWANIRRRARRCG